jgi:L-threonylcarbamoyladenylate synthase
MKLLAPTNNNIKISASELKNGNLVAFPTETVYGLGADGLNSIAVTKIFEAKQRPTFNPLILHVNSEKMLSKVAVVDNKKVKELIKTFWPGPLTLILPKRKIVPDIVTAGLDTVAVRMPNNKIALQLIKELGNPIAAPSANSFGKLSPTTAEHVVKQLGEKVDIVLDGGNCNVGVESTIVEVTESGSYLLRPGGISKEELKNIIGEIEIKKNEENPNSPGQLKIHYAPEIPIYFYDEKKVLNFADKKLGGLFFQKSKNEKYFTSIKILSTTGNLREAASNIFSFLHEFENENLDMIFVEKFKEKGLGIAIMDRLTKAVNKYL